MRYALHYTRVADESAAFYVDNFAKINPNKAIKDPEKQSAWIATAKEKLVQKAHLSGVTGKVAAWALVNVEDPSLSVKHTDSNERLLVSALSEEIGMLAAVEDGTATIYIKGCRNFTLPFLLRRMTANKITMPGNLKMFRDPSSLLGTESSQCAEITPLSDDLWLLNKEMLPSFDTKLNYEMAYSKGDTDAKDQLEQECVDRARFLAEYVKAIGGVFA